MGESASSLFSKQLQIYLEIVAANLAGGSINSRNFVPVDCCSIASLIFSFSFLNKDILKVS